MEEEEEAEEGAPEWITTFADLMSLLLTFFILMLSFSSMKAEKLKEMVTAVNKSMGITQNQFSSAPEAVDIPAIVERSSETPGTSGSTEKISELLKNFVASKGFSSSISIDTNKRGIVMRVKNDILFRKGKAALEKSLFPVLDELAKIIRNKPFFVSVDGHTDDLPTNSMRYPSNWELGADRAGSVARYLIGEGHMSPKRFQVVSFSSKTPMTKYGKENKIANRRVEIVLSREK